MDSTTGFVGLDYHQSFIEVDVLDGAGQVLSHFRCSNDWLVLTERVSRLGVTAVHAAIESCAGAADLTEELVQHAGWSVDLAHPGFVNRMKQNPDKSDYSDARLLADLVRVGYLPRVWLAPQDIRDLRQLGGLNEHNPQLRIGRLDQAGRPAWAFAARLCSVHWKTGREWHAGTVGCARAIIQPPGSENLGHPRHSTARPARGPDATAGAAGIVTHPATPDPEVAQYPVQVLW